MDATNVSNILDSAYGTVSQIDYELSLSDAMQGPTSAPFYQHKPQSTRPVHHKKTSQQVVWDKNSMDRPKRPLSAYNIFFQIERERLIQGESNKGAKYTAEALREVVMAHKAKKGKRSHRKTHGKIGFTELAKTIANRWKVLPEADKKLFAASAKIEKDEYTVAVEKWKERQMRAAERAATWARPITTKQAPSPVKLSPRKVSLEPSTSGAAGHGPRSPDSVLQQKQFVSTSSSSRSSAHYHNQAAPAPASASDSLYSLVGQMGGSLERDVVHRRYQLLMEQQLESELLQKQLQREIMMAGAYGSSMSDTLGQQRSPYNAMMPVVDSPSYAAEQKYYDVAQQTYDMMQLTLPAMSRSSRNRSPPRATISNYDSSPVYTPSPIHTPRVQTPVPPGAHGDTSGDELARMSPLDESEDFRDTFE